MIQALTQPLVTGMLPEGRFLRMARYGLLVVAGSMLIAISAQIKVPFWPVPATLQTLAIFAIAAAFGRKMAVATLCLYLFEGAVGLPVFTGGGGLAYFSGPTAGYLAGFVVMAAITGWAADRGWGRNVFALAGANLVGEAVMLMMGTAWITLMFGFEKAVAWGIGPFIIPDLIKLALAAAIVSAAGNLMAKR